ncbi:MAG: hypothetical protein AAGA06_09045 [Pseudomonadota bacterium]
MSFDSANPLHGLAIVVGVAILLLCLRLILALRLPEDHPINQTMEGPKMDFTRNTHNEDGYISSGQWSDLYQRDSDKPQPNEGGPQL